MTGQSHLNLLLSLYDVIFISQYPENAILQIIILFTTPANKTLLTESLRVNELFHNNIIRIQQFSHLLRKNSH